MMEAWEWVPFGPACGVHGRPCLLEWKVVAMQMDIFDEIGPGSPWLPPEKKPVRVDRPSSVSGEGEGEFPF